MDTEFYDQNKWLETHKHADEWICPTGITDNGVQGVALAVYYSPDERMRRDGKQYAYHRYGQIDWGELRDILNLPSTDCDKQVVINEIKQQGDRLSTEEWKLAIAMAALEELAGDNDPERAEIAENAINKIKSMELT